MKNPDYEWRPEIPKTIGLWEIRCMETSQQPSPVAITNRGAQLFAHSGGVGVNPLKHYHDGLTLVQWRKLA